VTFLMVPTKDGFAHHGWNLKCHTNKKKLKKKVNHMHGIDHIQQHKLYETIWERNGTPS
jgi:hypothetical protein